MKKGSQNSDPCRQGGRYLEVILGSGLSFVWNIVELFLFESEEKFPSFSDYNYLRIEQSSQHYVISKCVVGKMILIIINRS